MTQHQTREPKLGGSVADSEVHETDIEEVDRNARAYGFEIGRGAPLKKTVETSNDNPFMSPDWKDQVKE